MSCGRPDLRRINAYVDGELSSAEAATTAWERSDVTAIGAAPVIVEAALALVLADALLEKLGGDAIVDLDAAWQSYCARLQPWWYPDGTR